MNIPRIPALLRAVLAAALLAGASAHAEIPLTQRQYLLDFHAATGGPGWADDTGWGGAEGTECTWYGVHCMGDTVTGLDLFQNNLASPPGVPLPDWSALPDLREISLGQNQLAGPVPAIAGLDNLVFFSIETNQFTGPLPSPAGLQHLERYYAFGNQFSGPIPALTNLPALGWVLLRDNQLTGALPAFAGTPALGVFSAQNNQLTGAIPALPAGLLRLVVDGNLLTGPAPTAPAGLLAGQSQLCANHLTPSPSPAWDAATGDTPWHADCTPAPPGLGVAAVPTLGEGALMLLSLAATALGLAALRRRV